MSYMSLSLVMGLVCSWELDSSLEALITCVGDNEIKLAVFKKLIERNKSIHAKGRLLGNGLMYMY